MHIINIIVFKQTPKKFQRPVEPYYNKFYSDFVHFRFQNIRIKFNVTVSCDFQLQKNTYELK